MTANDHAVAATVDATDHGTYAGYQAHRREATATCPECKKAAAEYMREWRRRNESQPLVDALLAEGERRGIQQARAAVVDLPGISVSCATAVLRCFDRLST